ncbi:hypothetical protein DR66_2052 [Delftia acidovorans]|uniref:hypothetical protein n=1 Tax=Delftia acidovorans TaxID=80866 RepID=UPI000500CB9C|nr:hypothetical protein [Delftia acidovorans]KFJ08906.1 hypothetical protein DR66_2052 [Delftia acidovorans]QQB52269.1 hypothetical protein I6H54_08435 [Delftia acidovorans]
MTDIVNIPDLLPISQYPALGSANFNQEAYDYAVSVPPAVARMREIAVACRTCSIAAQEYATVAQGHAGNALTYSNNAANSAGSATTAAGNALTSANNAAASASGAAASYAAMQKLYLGSKTSNPTTDNQGNALQVGAWYTYIGTDPAYKGVWLWWDGTAWNPGIGPVAATLMPKTGGAFSGHVSGPTGATGAQHPQAQEVMLKAPEFWGKDKLMGDLGVGYALMTTSTGRGADWPVEGYDENFQAWDVTTIGVGTRMVQTATQVFTTNAYARTQGSTWMRCRHDAVWGSWSRMFTDTTAMNKQVTVNQPAGTPTYTVDPALGGVHVVTINATCQFILPIGRQYGDEVTLHVISAGAIRAITFSANVRLPIDGTGALLPFPQYPAGGMVSLIFTCNLVNRWECFYAGVH